MLNFRTQFPENLLEKSCTEVSFVDTSMDGEYGSAFEAKRGFSAFNQAEVTVIESTLRALIASAAIAPHEVPLASPRGHGLEVR